MDDRSLAEACRRGDRAAWDEFVSRYARFISYAARKLMRVPTEEEIQDVVQNVFLELLRENRRAWSRYDPRFRLTTWLGLVVRTQVDRALRGKKSAPWDDRIRELEADVGAAADDAREALRRAMGVLSERERLMVALYYEDGLAIKEIETVTGVPANTIGSHLLRARDKLRRSLLEVR